MSDMASESSKKVDVKVTEHSVKPSFGARMKNFLKRWWWLLLLLLVVLVLVIVLPLIFVGFPRKAQKGVDDSTLDIQDMKFLDPTPESFHLQQESILHSTSSFEPQLDAFNASLFLLNTLPNIKPFAYVQLPALKATHTAKISLDQNVEIADLEQFTDYTKLVLSSEEYQLGIRGRTGLKEGSLKTNVNYNEVVTLKGLNNLKGFNVTSVKVQLTPLADGTNMLGTVFIPNPSVLTIAMGNVTMNLSVDGDFIGTSTINDLTLVPGDNNFDMRSIVNQTIILNKFTKAKNGVLLVDVQGNSSVYDGKHLTYFEEALKSSSQQVELSLAAALGGL